MGTAHADIFSALAAPFEPSEVKSRPAGGGRSVHYITARSAMNRLDTVVGPERWRNRFRREPLTDGTDCVVCTIELRLGDEWVPKEDAGGFREMTEKDRGSGATVVDRENTVKTGYSDSFKRAAALWGVGRYLYGDGDADFREPADRAAAPSANGHREQAHGDLEDHCDRRPVGTRNPAGQEVPRVHEVSDAPRTGKALYAWCMDQEKRHDVALVKYLNGWAKAAEFSGWKMSDWTDEEVALGYAEAVRKLRETGHGAGGAEEHPPPANPDALRKQLVNAVWKIAKADTGKDRPSDGDYFAALADLDNAVAGSGGRVIPEITDCREPALLSAYLRAARDRLDAAGV